MMPGAAVVASRYVAAGISSSSVLGELYGCMKAHKAGG
jgi:hypothetical protein